MGKTIAPTWVNSHQVEKRMISAWRETLPRRALRIWGARVLGTYRLYRLDGAGRIATAEWIESVDDAHAERHARELKLDCTCEVWDRKRLIARVEPIRK